MKKRILAWLLASLMLLSTAACGNSNPPADTTDAADTTDPVDTADSSTADTTDTTAPEDEFDWQLLSDNLPANDFNGQVMTIYCGTNQGPDEITVLEMKSTTLSDAQYYAREEVEDRFNMSFDIIDLAKVQKTDFQKFIKAITSTGEETACLGKELASSMTSLMTSGYLLDLSASPQFDFTREWYYPATEQLAIGAHHFLVCSTLSIVPIDRAQPLVLNTEIAEEYNITIPYEDIFAGNWYLDDWMEMAAKVSDDTDGDGEVDRFGWAFWRQEVSSIQTSMGVAFIKKDENNMPVYVDDSERASIFMEKMESFVDSSCVLETGYWGIDDWVEGRTLACNPTLNRIVKDMLKSGYAYAVLPVPKLDENQEDYMFGVYDHFWGIPTTSYSNMEFVATVTEALQCAHYNKVLPAYYDTILNGRLAECREDAQVLSMIPSRIYLNPGIAIGTSTFKLDNLLLNAKGGKTASTVATVSKSITKQINSFVKKINAIVEDQQ